MCSGHYLVLCLAINGLPKPTYELPSNLALFKNRIHPFLMSWWQTTMARGARLTRTTDGWVKLGPFTPVTYTHVAPSDSVFLLITRLACSQI